MSRVIATNEIKEEFDDVLETPLANFPLDFDVSCENAHELKAAEAHCSSTSTTTSNISSSQLSAENDDQNCTAKSNTASDDSMTEEEGEDISTDKDQDESDGKRIKILYLNCTQPDCDDKLDTLDLFREHLRNKHGLAPFQCFCGCKSRFDESWQIFRHLHNRPASEFVCSVCAKVFSTQGKTNLHWWHNHQIGQFQCNIDDCSKVEVIRSRLCGHQQHHHCPKSKRHQCPHDGCSSSFVRKSDLKVHQMIHLNTKPFHCKWPKCVYCTNRRTNLIRHIRDVHFKNQQENGIVGERDPTKYVRVMKK